MNKKQDLMENLFAICGMFLVVSCVFLLRNISVIMGINLPLSGNIEMRYAEVEIWRFIVFIIAIAITVLLWKLNYKNIEIFKEYKSSFIFGVRCTIIFELFMNVFSYLMIHN